MVAVAVVQSVIALNSGPAPATLVGTIGSSMALLKMLDNSQEACEVGETVKGITILSIKPSEVEIRFNGQVQILTRPADPSDK